MNGVQEPTFEQVPTIADAGTADDALELVGLAGIALLPWQVEQVRRILGLAPSGEWAAPRVGIAVPRQSGKGTVLETVTLAKAVLLGERVLWTAHEVRTMQEAFTRLRGLLDAHPSLQRQVRDVRSANGQERVRFVNGAEVRFSARSKSATRGLGFRTIIADEAQELDYLTLGAMLPTLSGQGDARTQLILTGTPPYSKAGEVFTDTRAAALAGGDSRLAWSEWAASPSDATADERVWARTNPSLGSIIRVEKIRDEYAALVNRPDVFRRERLGEWGVAVESPLAIDQQAWGAAAVEPGTPAVPHPDRGERVFLGVDTTFENQSAVLCSARWLEDGRIWVRVEHSAPGVAWVAEQVAEHRPKLQIAFDPVRTTDLTHDLRAAGVRDGVGPRYRRVFPAAASELTQACAGLVRAVAEGRIVHNGDPRLGSAVASATRSSFDDGRSWKFVPGPDGGSVQALVAAALAVRRAETFPWSSRGRTSITW